MLNCPNCRLGAFSLLPQNGGSYYICTLCHQIIPNDGTPSSSPVSEGALISTPPISGRGSPVLFSSSSRDSSSRASLASNSWALEPTSSLPPPRAASICRHCSSPSTDSHGRCSNRSCPSNISGNSSATPAGLSPPVIRQASSVPASGFSARDFIRYALSEPELRVVSVSPLPELPVSTQLRPRYQTWNDILNERARLRYYPDSNSPPSWSGAD